MTLDVGYIFTSSVPSKASVFLDGKYKGKTPVNFNATYGTHEIKITMPDYEDHIETLQINPKDNYFIEPNLIAKS